MLEEDGWYLKRQKAAIGDTGPTPCPGARVKMRSTPIPRLSAVTRQIGCIRDHTSGTSIKAFASGADGGGRRSTLSAEILENKQRSSALAVRRHRNRGNAVARSRSSEPWKRSPRWAFRELYVGDPHVDLLAPCAGRSRW